MLLSRPILSSDAALHHAAFLLLSRDRQNEIHSSFAGSFSRPLPITRDAIRREAKHMALAGDALEDFVAIVTIIDDYHVELETKRLAAEAAAAAQRERARR